MLPPQNDGGAAPRRLNWSRMLLAASMGFLTYLMLTSVLKGNAGNGSSNGNSHPAYPSLAPVGANAAQMAELSYESRVLEQEASGLVFPRTLNSSSRYEGTWVLRAGVDSRDVGFNLVPNRTLRYMVPSIAARIASEFPLPSTSGGAAMIVESYPIFDAVLGVQAVRGAVAFYDGAGSSNSLTKRVFGRYYADGGLLFAVASVSGGDVDLVPPSLLVPPSRSRTVSATASSSATASPSPDCSGAQCQSISASASASSSDSASSTSSLAPVLPSPSPNTVPGRAAQESVVLTDERETCILLMALRTRAVGFDPTWLPMPQSPQDPFPSASRPGDRRRAAEVAFRELLVDAGGAQLMDGAPLVSAVAALEERQLLGDGDAVASAQLISKLSPGRVQDVVSRVFGGVMRWARWVFRSGPPPFSLSAPLHEEADTAALHDTANDPQELPAERAVPIAQPVEPHLPPVPPRSAAGRDELLIRQAPSSSVEHHRSSKHVAVAAASDAAAALPPRTPGRQLLATAAPPQLLGAESLSTQASGGALGVPPAEDEAAAVARRRRVEAAAIDSLYPGYSFVPMYGRAVSPNCNFSLDVAFTVASIDSNRFEIKVLLYSLFVLGVALALLFATFHELVASMSETFAFRISMVSVGINMLADGAMFLAHVFFAFSQVQAVMMGLLASSLLFLMLFSFLGMRLLLMVEKARHPERYAGGAAALTSRMWAMQRRAAVAIVLVAGVMLEGRGWGLLVLTLAACSFWLPQIIHSARHNARPGITPMYLWGSTIARLAVPVYLLACPNNIAWFIVPLEPQNAALAWAAAAAATPPAKPFEYAPDAVHSLLRLRAGTAPAFATPDGEALFFREAAFAAVLACWMLAQAVVVFFQSKTGWGPRFFIPDVFLPQRYDYHRRFAVRDGRVVPDPEATAAHMVSAAAAAAAGPAAAVAAAAAAGAGGAAPAAADRGGTRLQLAWAALEARGTAARRNASWFASRCRVLVAQWLSGERRAPAARAAPPPQAAAGAAVLPWRHWWPFGAARPYERIQDGEGDEAPPPPPGGAVAEAAGADAGLDAAEDGRAGAAATAAFDPALEEMVGDDVPVLPVAAASQPGATDASGAAGAAAVAEGGLLQGPPPAHVDCVVCQDPVALPLRRREYMITPCDHLFHTGCLRPWLEQRLECPTCRMRLPEPLAAPAVAPAVGQ